MAEAASGAGDVTLDGERGKRPPPEGEPAAPVSGVLGMFAAGGTGTGVRGAPRGCRGRRSGSHTLACGPEAATRGAAAAAQRAGVGSVRLHWGSPVQERGHAPLMAPACPV